MEQAKEIQDKLRESGMNIDDEIRYNEDDPNQLSGAISTLYAPFAELANDYAGQTRLVGMACAAWNISFTEKSTHLFAIDDFIDNALTPDADPEIKMSVRQFIQELIERKWQLFPDDERRVASFNVVETKSQYKVMVAGIVKK
jgi:hypothetical protein